MERRERRASERRTFRTAAALLAGGLVFGAGPALAQDGAALYDEHCAKCHGPKAMSETPVGKAMKVPALAEASLETDAVVATVREGAKHKSVAAKVNDDEVAAIVEHIRTLASGG